MFHQDCHEAICVLYQEQKGKQKYRPHGVVTFHQCKGARGCQVHFSFQGFKPGTVHAIHIHEKGNTLQGCKSLGGHWNPHGATHGSIQDPTRPRHVGDLINNMMIDDHGNFEYDYWDPLLRLSGALSIVGRSVVIHEGQDDLGKGGTNESLKTGSAGARLMCGVIGWT